MEFEEVLSEYKEIVKARRKEGVLWRDLGDEEIARHFWLAARKDLEEENIKLRDLLWQHHGHMAYLYGDDGEKQCAKCFLDFKRDDIDTIVERCAPDDASLLQQKINRLKAFIQKEDEALWEAFRKVYP